MRVAFTVVLKPRSLNAKLKKDYTEAVSQPARRVHPGPPLNGPLYSRIVWFHKYVSTQGDIDNIAKRIHDALKGVIFIDDNVITHTAAIRVDASRGVKIIGDPLNSEAEQELAALLGDVDAPDLIYIEIGIQTHLEVHLGPVQ